MTSHITLHVYKIAYRNLSPELINEAFIHIGYKYRKLAAEQVKSSLRNNIVISHQQGVYDIT